MQTAPIVSIILLNERQDIINVNYFIYLNIKILIFGTVRIQTNTHINIFLNYVFNKIHKSTGVLIAQHNKYKLNKT